MEFLYILDHSSYQLREANWTDPREAAKYRLWQQDVFGGSRYGVISVAGLIDLRTLLEVEKSV